MARGGPSRPSAGVAHEAVESARRGPRRTADRGDHRVSRRRHEHRRDAPGEDAGRARTDAGVDRAGRGAGQGVLAAAGRAAEQRLSDRRAGRDDDPGRQSDRRPERAAASRSRDHRTDDGERPCGHPGRRRRAARVGRRRLGSAVRGALRRRRRAHAGCPRRGDGHGRCARTHRHPHRRYRDASRPRHDLHRRRHPPRRRTRVERIRPVPAGDRCGARHGRQRAALVPSRHAALLERRPEAQRAGGRRLFAGGRARPARHRQPRDPEVHRPDRGADHGRPPDRRGALRRLCRRHARRRGIRGGRAQTAALPRGHGERRSGPSRPRQNHPPAGCRSRLPRRGDRDRPREEPRRSS